MLWVFFTSSFLQQEEQWTCFIFSSASGANMAPETNKTKMTINMALVRPNQDIHTPFFFFLQA